MNFDLIPEPILTFIGGVVAAALVYFSAKSRNTNDAAAEANRTIMGLIAPLQETVDRQGAEIRQLRERVRKLEAELHSRDHYIDWLTEGIDRLIAQVRDAGLEPVFDPDKTEGPADPWGD